MKRSSKRSSFAVVALTLLAAAGTSLYSHAQTQTQPPSPARSRSDEMLDRWNAIGNKLVAMAQDFPEDKYDFKVQKDERTFADNLLHAAALDFVLIRRISGSNIGPDFGEGDNPSRDVFKTKADVVKFVQEAVADGAQVIQQQGDAGLDKTSKFFGKRLAHNSSIWMFAIEHSGEHYGQLVVYYRANNLVPPDSRRNQAQQSQPTAAARVVDLKAFDGAILKASYFSAGKPGPGVLLFHQNDRSRTSWDDVAAPTGLRWNQHARSRRPRPRRKWRHTPGGPTEDVGRHGNFLPVPDLSARRPARRHWAWQAPAATASSMPWKPPACMPPA
jgi:uncharacterized damage-inducible protein DinB